MEKTRNIFPRTRSLGSTLLGIALFTVTNFCECKVTPLQTTPQAVTTTPKPTCSFNNINYRDGEKWNPFLLPYGYYRCIRCSCKVTETKRGSIATVDCKTCKNTNNGRHPEEGQNNCTYEMKTRKHGTVWTVATNDSNSLRDNQCTECSCIDGFVTCAVRTCPVLSCTNRRNGTRSCCPVCRGDLQRPRDSMGCETMGRYYGHFETWSPRIPPKHDLCDSCVCKNASVECRKPDCPKITCKDPVRKPGACCDSCPANSPTWKPSNLDMEIIGSLIPKRYRVHKLLRKAELLIYKSRVGRKATKGAGACEWRNRTFPHSSSFHPTVELFGVNYCVLCLCNDTKLNCSAVRCPKSYSCANPVSVPKKCCKECKEGSGNTSTPGSNGSMKRGSGKYWRVYVYTNIKGKQRNTKTNVRVQFALEDKERDFVEIHALIANMTVKKVTVTNITKQAFDKIRKELQKQQGNFQYIYIGKIREVQRVKMSTNERRPCHQTQGCIHTVRRIMYRLRNRVRNPSDPLDTLRMPENDGT